MKETKRIIVLSLAAAACAGLMTGCELLMMWETLMQPGFATLNGEVYLSSGVTMYNGHVELLGTDHEGDFNYLATTFEIKSIPHGTYAVTVTYSCQPEQAQHAVTYEIHGVRTGSATPVRGAYDDYYSSPHYDWTFSISDVSIEVSTQLELYLGDAPWS